MICKPCGLVNAKSCFYIYIYIYILSSMTDCFVLLDLFCRGRLKRRSKPVQLYIRLSIRPPDQQAYQVGWGNYKVLCSNCSSSVRLFTFLYPIGYQSAQFFRRALHYASSGRKFLRQSAQPPMREIYFNRIWH